jgi:multidrug efflux pump subunit AcrA (membrane-fusion protein)
MKRWLKPTLFVLVAALLALGWIAHFHNDALTARLPKWGWVQATVKHLGEHKEAAPDEDEDPDNTKNEIPVHTTHIEVRTLHRYIEGFGAVAPRPPRPGQMAGSANLASPVAGVVAKVLCQIGQQVKAGDPVIQLDDRLAKSAEEQAAAALAQAEASLAALKATPRPDQLEIAQLTVDKSQSAVQFAQKNYDRLKTLAADQGTSGKNVEQAASELAAAQKELAIAQRQLELLKNSPTPQELAQEQAKVKQAAAALATAQTQLKMMTITAPIDATVVALPVNPGESVDPTKALVQFVAMDRLMVDVDVPTEQLPAKAQGLEAQVLLASDAKDGGNPITGKVALVSPQVDPKSGAVMVGIDLPADTTLRPGQAVRVRIIAEEHKDVLAVPREAVVADENGDSVIAVLEGDQATHKAVKAGLEENGMIEIEADGIKEGMTVVTAGAYGLPQASRVRVLD